VAYPKTSDLKALPGLALDDSDPEGKVVLSRVALEVNTRLQQGSPASADYMAEVTVALSQIQQSAIPDLRINILLDVSQYFYVIGQPFKGLASSQLAVELATKADLKPLLRRALTILGAMYADTGNISRAIECYAHALELLPFLKDPIAECVVWVNLGGALVYAAQYRDALACFEHVIQLASQSPTLQSFRSTAFSNIALCALHLEDYSRGLKACEAAVKDRLEPHSAGALLSGVLMETCYARLLLEVNNIELARERCEIARRFAKRSNSARAEIAASCAEGLYEVYAGRVDVGISRLTSTLEKARLLRSMLRDTLSDLVKAYEFVGQPQRALIYLREMIQAMRESQVENALKHVKLHVENLGQEVVGDAPITTRLQRREAALQGQVAEQELFRSRIEMLERLAVTAELRDDSTGEHSYRVGKLSGLLAQEFGCEEHSCFMIELAARLHDIGKIGVPDAILLKPEKLNDAERHIMRTHTTVGAELLSKSNIPELQMAEEIARHHHEWWDGSGYPGNLSGSAIPLAARITSLADVFDALTHRRPYKIAWPLDAALDEIARLKGRQFDPQLTDLFIVLVGRLRQDHIDIDSYLGQAAHGSPFLQARTRIWNALHRSHDGDGEGSSGRLDLQR
jgi:putative two-component system response regulator